MISYDALSEVMEKCGVYISDNTYGL